jgi:hypothetical protein
MGVQEDMREVRNSIDNAFNCIPMQWDGFIQMKIENGLQINIDRITTSQEELKMRHWVITRKP